MTEILKDKLLRLVVGKDNGLKICLSSPTHTQQTVETFL